MKVVTAALGLDTRKWRETAGDGRSGDTVLAVVKTLSRGFSTDDAFGNSF